MKLLIMILTWVAGRNALRQSDGRVSFPKEILYSRGVQDDLVYGASTLLPPGLPIPRNSAEWEFHLHRLHSKGMCLCLLKAGIENHPLLVLSAEEKQQIEYYMFTDSKGSALPADPRHNKSGKYALLI